MVIFQGIQIASASLMTIPFRRWVRAEEEADRVKVASVDKGGSDSSEPPGTSPDTRDGHDDYALRAFSSH